MNILSTRRNVRCTMVTQGNNTAWNEAIKLAEINATPEGVARAEKVKADRNREYTKNEPVRIVRRKKRQMRREKQHVKNSISRRKLERNLKAVPSDEES